MKASALFTRDICNGFAGNSDLYGLGIRVGIYLQWISSLLTNILLLKGVPDSLDTNSIFLFAVFIAIANATNATGGLHPAEAFIMLQLCFGYLLSVLSVTGLRLTLFNVAGLEPLLSKLQDHPNLIDVLPSEIQQYFDLQAILSSESPAKALRSQLKAIKSRIPFKDLIEKPPPGISLPSFQLFQLQMLNFLAVYSLFPEVFNGDYVNYSLEPAFWLLDLYVFLRLAKFTANDTPMDPVKYYRHERYLNYKKNRKLAMECMRPRVFSLGLTSVYKSDQISWLGVVWRSCIVAGIGMYNIWFWFAGIEFLTTDSCPKFVFLFCKANMLGGARIFFKVLSIVYIVYSGALLLWCCYIMIAFMGTAVRSLLINAIIFPYTELLILIASIGNQRQKRWLKYLDATRSDFLRWLDIPNMRQLLSAFAYLSSNSKEIVILGDAAQDDEEPLQKNVWLTRLKIFFVLATIFTITLTIITVELTLAYNSISGVYTIESTGQLIPLIIGIVGVGRTLNAITINRIKKTYPNWSDIVIFVDARNRVVIRDKPDADDRPASPGNASIHNVPLQDSAPEEDQRQHSPQTSSFHVNSAQSSGT